MNIPPTTATEFDAPSFDEGVSLGALGHFPKPSCLDMFGVII